MFQSLLSQGISLLLNFFLSIDPLPESEFQSLLSQGISLLPIYLLGQLESPRLL